MVFEVNFLVHVQRAGFLKRIFLGKSYNSNTCATVWLDKNYCEVYLPIVFKIKNRFKRFEDELSETILHESLHSALYKVNSPCWEDEEVIETLCEKIMKKGRRN